jgi:hypothetical protein
LAVGAYELEPPNVVANVSFPRAIGHADVWHAVANMPDGQIDFRSDSVLFLCWPPGWGNTMASDVLAAYESAGGERLVFIGEPKGGKTGNDAFFDALSDRWQLGSTDESFVSWWNLADTAARAALIYQHKTPGRDQRIARSLG